MIIGVGTDICNVSRVAKVLEKPYSQTFKKKVFTDGEILYCEKMKNTSHQRFAVRWAVKEAFYKALPEKLQEISYWKSVEFLSEEEKNGNENAEKKPRIFVSDQKLADALNAFGVSKIHCSVSHEKEFCTAFVVLEGLEKRK